MDELLGFEPYAQTQISAIFYKHPTQIVKFRCHELSCKNLIYIFRNEIAISFQIWTHKSVLKQKIISDNHVVEVKIHLKSKKHK